MRFDFVNKKYFHSDFGNHESYLVKIRRIYAYIQLQIEFTRGRKTKLFRRSYCAFRTFPSLSHSKTTLGRKFQLVSIYVDLVFLKNKISTVEIKRSGRTIYSFTNTVKFSLSIFCCSNSFFCWLITFYYSRFHQLIKSRLSVFFVTSSCCSVSKTQLIVMNERAVKIMQSLVDVS